MKYYVIEETIGIQTTRILCVVENEEIAKDIIKRYYGLSYYTYETEDEQQNESNFNEY